MKTPPRGTNLDLVSHVLFTSLYRLRFFPFFLVVLRGSWDLSSPTRDQTWDPVSESTKSYPLDHQGSLDLSFFLKTK